MGHTPGPWSVPHFARPEVNCECGFVLVNGHMGAVCEVYASGDGDDVAKHGDNPLFEEAVANAHLIAAAPNLLAALKAALPYVGKYESEHESNTALAVYTAGLDALSKAEPSP